MTKVLIIEDSEALLNDIVEMLSLEGFETIRAENGKVGVDIVADNRPDLIVCDIRMPVMDGYGVLDQIRSDPVTANIPFIFLTARTGRGEVREGMEMGADDYLTKPFTAEELISSVRSRLARKESAKQETERQLNELRKNITLALPHELRTPLNAIMGFSEIIVHDADNLQTDQVKEMATHINKAAMRLYRLVENYVLYANLEILDVHDERSKALRQGHAPYGIVTIEQQARVKAQTYGREADLVIVAPENYATLAIDGENLARIVQELVDNAFKFSRMGTPVWVEVEVDAEYLTLMVTDKGHGIPPEQMEKIGAYMQFERAFLEQQGIGFGLTIARRMVELHAGQFEIESELGSGTRIVLKLPLVDEASIS